MLPPALLRVMMTAHLIVGSPVLHSTTCAARAGCTRGASRGMVRYRSGDRLAADAIAVMIQPLWIRWQHREAALIRDRTALIPWRTWGDTGSRVGIGRIAPWPRVRWGCRWWRGWRRRW